MTSCPVHVGRGSFDVGDGRRVKKSLRFLAMAFAAVLTVAPAAGASTMPDRLVASAPGLRPQVLALAMKAYEHARELGQTASSIVTLIDYSLPSTERRLWVLDVRRGALLFHELVAHGRLSGDDLATSFSNRPGSQQSSLGSFVTGETYAGRHGLSLRLRGLDPGLNDNAEEREIVMHGAPYVSLEAARVLGHLGRSLGCPAVRPEVASRIIRTIKDGTFLFAYYPDPALQSASYLN